MQPHHIRHDLQQAGDLISVLRVLLVASDQAEDERVSVILQGWGVRVCTVAAVNQQPRAGTIRPGCRWLAVSGRKGSNRVSLVYTFVAPPSKRGWPTRISGSASLGAGSRVRTSRVQKLKPGAPPGDFSFFGLGGLLCDMFEEGQGRLITCCPLRARENSLLDNVATSGATFQVLLGYIEAVCWGRRVF